MTNRAPEDAKREVDPRLDLAVQRTELALDRTQLSWTRTVITFIVAGVGLDKGLQALHEARLLAGEAWVRNGHVTGLTLIGGGTVLLIVVTLDYWQRKRALARMKGVAPPWCPLALLASLLAILLGAILFVVLLGDKWT
jgi:uncharacterized membrane protein YidH (DUF202 family)